MPNFFTEKLDSNGKTPGKIQVVPNTRHAPSIKHQRVFYPYSPMSCIVDVLACPICDRNICMFPWIKFKGFLTPLEMLLTSLTETFSTPFSANSIKNFSL